MESIQRFAEYAAAFEKSFESDDWSHVEPFFTETAVYETIGDNPMNAVVEGRGAVLAHLKGSLDGFDRRYDSRELELTEGPALRDGAVWIRWRARYRVGDAPTLEIDGEERAWFDGDRIRRLEDRFAPGTVPKMLAHMSTHLGDVGSEV